MRFQAALSPYVETTTGAPQGTVLSPLLFTLYINDCSGTTLKPFIEYPDGIALDDLSDNDAIYFNEVSRFNVSEEVSAKIHVYYFG